MATYPVSSTVFNYVENEGIYYLQIIDTNTNEILQQYSACTLEVSLQNGSYVVESLTSYPTNAQKVIFDKDAEGVEAINFQILNSTGVGTVDYRDCGRRDSWLLDVAPSLYISNYPNGDLTQAVLWAGVGEEYVEGSYSTDSTCG